MDEELKEQAAFWMGLMTNISANTQTPITEISRMDIFDFFSLVGVVEAKNKK